MSPGSDAPSNLTQLLDWATRNTPVSDGQANQDSERPPPKKLDPMWIDLILGKDDPVMMKECCEKFSNPELCLDERVQALEDLAGYVAQVDNAKNLKPLKIWEPLMAHITPENSMPLRTACAEVVHTAVQNNPTSQKDFVELNGLDKTIDMLSNTKDGDLQVKFILILSSVIRHCFIAFERFYLKGGFNVLVEFIKSGSNKQRLKAMFTILNLLFSDDQEIVKKTLNSVKEQYKLYEAIDMLKGAFDIDIAEKSMELLARILELDPSALSSEEKRRICEILPSIEERFSKDSANGEISGDIISELRARL